MAATERTLSKNEAKVVLDLEWRGQKTVSTEDLRSMLGASDGYARSFAHRLVEKRWLERIRPGLFQLIPADRGREGIGDTNPLAVGALLADPYFYSFGTACTHHGFTEQVFADVYIACRAPRRPVRVRDSRFVFVSFTERRFFGLEEVDVLGAKVRMATKERALLDALDRPAYAGGISEVSRIVARASSRISWPKLLGGLEQWGESAVAQRLGYLLDVHGIDLAPSVRRRLLHHVAADSKLHLGPRSTWGPRGRLASTWGIIE
ncbi:MAG: type IV toxin-antitoxin system AbiEi family antitoxin domain-containing protein, partial [Polyangiaceae bacterium]